MLAAGGCAFDPSAVQLPGATVSGPTYRIHIEFANVLNLPARAKVASNGVQVGTLHALKLIGPTSTRESYVIADIDIQKAVRLPTTTSAQLRQATVLGDTYIALLTPPGAATGAMTAEDTVPLQRTRPAPQIEDTMASIATFVGGGAVNQAQDIINRVNAGLPQKPEDTARISTVFGTDFSDVAAHLDQVEAFLDGMEAVTDATVDNGPASSALLTDAGTTQAINSTNSLVATLGMFGALGNVAHSLAWLTPLVSAGDAAAKAFVPLAFTSRPLDLNAPSNLNALVALLRDKIIPFAEYGPKVNVVDIDLGTSKDDQIEQIIATLRMIGAVR
ncbi:MlaD family protein [Nocardia sp. NPDC051756]|uniref:MlaD family protein n=1 Tax=Nocardia sp. NPDC051756 TaxID=3154751 RepID=UPI00343C6B3E